MRGGGERRGEADAAGLPGEEAGVGERIQPLFSAAGEAGDEDATARSGRSGGFTRDLCSVQKEGFYVNPDSGCV